MPVKRKDESISSLGQKTSAPKARKILEDAHITRREREKGFDQVEPKAPVRGFQRVQSISRAANQSALSSSSATSAPILINSPTNPLTWSSSRRILEVLIEAENHHPTENNTADDQGGLGKPYATQGRENRIVDQGKQLLSRLDRLNLDMVVMVGDGNCQFRALSNELYGTQEDHVKVRGDVVQYIKDHADDFSPFLDEDFNAYVKAMSKSGTWGDELTLRAACEMFGVIIRCITSEESNWYISYQPEQHRIARELFLAYISPIHYNTVRRRTSYEQLRLRLGSGFSALKGLWGGGLQRLGSFRAAPISTPSAGNTTARQATGSADLSSQASLKAQAGHSTSPVHSSPPLNLPTISD
ncbi:hypothetical protein CEUSTIGMA_g3101.t1 [Chlamydomonas eustigma]|uniref:OTU domain-containing protein n=1 Tax=Chlamydomonas eustigma TaxID=1157962 RepID=A0A250WXU5_9CHLO|nr:hypothetical protein CEUSTIGMA_g3101.t1 [Chlamydomonas eustigma]|eukprot:GAX75657.1 hypothetical protein CEUSTIGMA_g3101.t1 [Chlamydomonas eustigma]